MLPEQDASTITRRVILALLLGALFVLGYLVLNWFIAPAVWAAILAYVTWPAYKRLRRLMRGYAMTSALVMTLLLTTAFVLPLLWLITLMQREFAIAYQAASAYMADGPHRLPDFVVNLPWIGERLQDFLNQITTDPIALREQLTSWARQWQGQLGELIGGVGRNAVKLGFALLTVVFIYRDGESLLDQVQRVLRRFLGGRVDGYIVAIGHTTTAVLYGLVLTALAQGLLAGVGYWFAGVRAPVLFGAFTALVALMPFGTPFVWGSLGAWLLFSVSAGDVRRNRRPRGLRPDRDVHRSCNRCGAAGCLARVAGKQASRHTRRTACGLSLQRRRPRPEISVSAVAAFHHAQRVIGEHGFAVLIDHPVLGAHQPALAFGCRAYLAHLALHMNGVADEGRPFDVQRCVQKRKSGALYHRQQQTFGAGIDQGRGNHTPRNRHAFPFLGIGKQLLGQPGKVDEVDQIGFGQRTSRRAKTVAYGKIVPERTHAQQFHLFFHFVPSKPSNFRPADVTLRCAACESGVRLFHELDTPWPKYWN